MIPESLRKIFSRSSGVLPRPVNCMANICSTTLVKLRPARHAKRFAIHSPPRAAPMRIGRHLFKYALIFESAAELFDSASRYATCSSGIFSIN